MVREISNIIAQELSKLPYSNLVRGWTIPVTASETTFPASLDIFKGGKKIRLNSGDYMPMVPNPNEPNIMFVDIKTVHKSQDIIHSLPVSAAGTITFWGDVCKTNGNISPQLALFQDANVTIESELGLFNVTTESLTEIVITSRYKLGDDQHLSKHPYQMFEIAINIEGKIKSCKFELTAKNGC